MSRLWRLARKELRESLRDRRTVLTLVLMPLLLYPVLAVAFQTLVLTGKADEAGPEYRIGLPDEATGRFLTAYWELGRAAESPDGTPPYLAPVPRVKVFTGPDLTRALRDGHIDVALRPKRERADAPRLEDRDHAEVEVLYRPDSPLSCEAVRWLERVNYEASTSDAADARVYQRLYVRPKALDVPPREASSLVPVLVPLILILMTMTGAVYPAIDLTAGERERGTLEILVAAPIPRLSVLLAKYVAVVTVALLTACVNLGTMAVTLQATGLGKAVFGASVTWLTFLQVLALLVLFAMFFSAVLLALTSFARSFKEAQAYIIPLMLLCMMPGVMALVPGLKLAGPLAVVPLVNIVLLARDVFAGAATPAVAGVVVLVTLFYALAAIALAARVFGTEAVLSSEGGTWADLFRRPDAPQPTATPTAALLTLALMFPLTFLLMTSLAQVEIPTAGKLALAGAVTLLVYGAVPTLAGWVGRVDPWEGYGLAAPRPLGWLAAALLGVSLWPFVGLLVEAMRWAGVTTLGGDHAELGKQLIERWREAPAWLLVVTMAALPALCEEFVFRGFVLRALLRGGMSAAQAVLTTAALFAAFHLFVHGTLAVEQLAASFALGLVLGALAWASGSLWPGVLLHALHNATLVLMAYHQPALIDAGWLPAEGASLPPLVLVTSGVLAALGGGVLYGMARSRRGQGEVALDLGGEGAARR